MEEEELHPHSFLNSSLNGGEWSESWPGRVSPKKSSFLRTEDEAR